MKRVRVVLVVSVSTAVLASAVGSFAASSPNGSGSPACLRGHWVASEAETQRVLRALVPIEGLQVVSKLYMQFRDGIFQYGTTSMKLKLGIGNQSLTARARFYTLAEYTARTGLLTLSPGESHIEYGPMTGTKDGRSYTVPGPAPRTTGTPAGSVPFQCHASTLKVRLPRFASLNWITLHRG